MEFFSVRHTNEDNFDNNFKEAVDRHIDASTIEQLIHEGTMDYAIFQIEVAEAIAQTQTADKSADPGNIH